MGVILLCGITFIVLLVSFFVGVFVSLNDVYNAQELVPATKHIDWNAIKEEVRTQEQENNSFVYTSMWLDID